MIYEVVHYLMSDVDVIGNSKSIMLSISLVVSFIVTVINGVFSYWKYAEIYTRKGIGYYCYVGNYFCELFFWYNCYY